MDTRKREIEKEIERLREELDRLTVKEKEKAVLKKKEAKIEDFKIGQKVRVIKKTNPKEREGRVVCISKDSEFVTFLPEEKNAQCDCPFALHIATQSSRHSDSYWFLVYTSGKTRC